MPPTPCVRSVREFSTERSLVDINYTKALALRAVDERVLHNPHGLLLSVSQPAGLCLRERESSFKFSFP